MVSKKNDRNCLPLEAARRTELMEYILKIVQRARLRELEIIYLFASRLN